MSSPVTGRSAPGDRNGCRSARMTRRSKSVPTSRPCNAHSVLVLHQRGEAVERGLGGRDRVGRQRHLGCAVIERGVEHHGPRVLRIKSGIVRRELGAVRQPEPTDPVDVQARFAAPRGRGRRSPCPCASPARRWSSGSCARPPGRGLACDRIPCRAREQRRGRCQQRDAALQRRAVADPPRIDADDVEPRSERLREEVSAARTYLTPPSPGPPGLKNSVPIRRAASSAGRRATATVDRADRAGRAQSSGTRKVPHCTRAEPGHGRQVMANSPRALVTTFAATGTTGDKRTTAASTSASGNASSISSRPPVSISEQRLHCR